MAMSALGQKRTSKHVRVMSALPPEADIQSSSWDFRFVQKASKGSAKNNFLWLAVVPIFYQGP
jgi:hypothetical protein